MQKALSALFTRDLEKLKEELTAYRHEENLWIVDNNIANSAGNLALHLVGNLNHFIGATLGNTGYVRQRELEFTQKSISRASLLSSIDATIFVVNETLATLTPADLQEDFPIIVFNKINKTEDFLLHLTTHLAYHLGQVNYHRRLLDL